MAIIDKPKYKTQEEIDLDNKISETLQPLLCNAVENGMTVEAMSQVAHYCVDNLVAEIYVNKIYNNTNMED